MSLKEYKCPSCGAKLRPEKWQGNIKCEYCLSTFSAASDGKINAQKEPPKQTPPPVQSAPPVYSAPPAQNRTPPTRRPKLSCFLTPLLLICGFWPGLIYIIYTLHKQSEWDSRYR